MGTTREQIYKWLSDQGQDSKVTLLTLLAQNRSWHSIASEIGTRSDYYATQDFHHVVKDKLGWEYDTETKRYIPRQANSG